ncbi:MAG TPA: hypothetical protein VFH78_11625 [Candidatus Thermoplasmatota archaeon]|nr:hypothetical protein [Candidatus Thermoplasmatota archaeon]
MPIPHESRPVFPAHALLSCQACGGVFVQWSSGAAACGTCGAADVREIRWPPR